MTASARRELVRQTATQGLSERRALAVAGMSASALRYSPRPDRNVFDRTADSRVIKCLTIVDDATHEAVAIETERAISGHGVVRVLEGLALSRGLPKAIRTDIGKEFCGSTMVTWAHEQGVLLRLIEPSKLEPGL